MIYVLESCADDFEGVANAKRYSRNTRLQLYLERTIIAFIAYMDENVWSHVRITDDTLPVTFLTETTKRNAWLLSAENQVRMMFCHSQSICFSQ